MTPEENGRIVDAALVDRYHTHTQPWLDARAALRDLVAQATLARDLGEALRAAHDPERWNEFLTMQVADLLTLLDAGSHDDLPGGRFE